MSQSELLQTLEKLHRELAATQEIEGSTRQALQSLLAEIQERITPPAEEVSTPAPVEPSLNQRLSDLVTDFEVRHPQLTATLSQVVDRLTDMGI